MGPVYIYQHLFLKVIFFNIINTIVQNNLNNSNIIAKIML